jgi:hypothetical protein
MVSRIIKLNFYACYCSVEWAGWGERAVVGNDEGERSELPTDWRDGEF